MDAKEVRRHEKSMCTLAAAAFFAAGAFLAAAAFLAAGVVAFFLMVVALVAAFLAAGLAAGALPAGALFCETTMNQDQKPSAIEVSAHEILNEIRTLTSLSAALWEPLGASLIFPLRPLGRTKTFFS